MESRRAAIALALAILSVAVIIPSTDSDAASVIGVGYDYDSPSGYYTLYLQYYSDDSIALQTSYTGSEPSSSEIGTSVFIRICEAGGTTINESSLVVLSESLWYSSIAGTVLTTGEYIVQIYTSEHTLIVYSKLAVGVSEITIDAPSEGSISPSPGKYTVPNGTVMTASGATLTLSFESVTIYTFTAAAPSGKIVDGWYSNDSKISSLTISADTEVEVRWTSAAVEYSLSYDANGGIGAPAEQSYSGPESSHTFTIPSTKPTRSGFIFKGWSDIASGTAQYLPGGTITLQSSLPSKTIYAVWEYQPIPPGPTDYTYRINYDANGGSGAPSSQSYTGTERSHTFTIPSTVPIREGFTFHGWSDSASGSAAYQPGASITLQFTAPTKILYAVWADTPVVPDIDDFTFDVDEIIVSSGMQYELPFTIDPPAAIAAVTWESSDESIATVSEGVISAIKEGTVTITAYDRDGSVLDTITITVTSSGKKEVEEKTDTEGGGSVIATYEIDKEGNKKLVNPIIINPGNLKKVTDDQVELAGRYIDILVQSGIDSHVIIPTKEQSVGVPSKLLAAIVDGHGSLTIIEGDVTLYFPWEVLDAIGCDDDLEFVILPVEVKESESTDIDVSGLDNVKVYDIYILKNGVKVAMTFPTAVTVTIDYPMKEGWTPDRLSVWYLDVEPRASVEFEYVEGEGVVFGVMHFSHYAVSYDEGKTPADDCCVWCWILILAVIVLILFLIWFFLWKRFKLTLTNDGGAIVSVPEGWKRESNSSISIRMRRKQEIVIPEIEAESSEGSHGMRIVGWDPEPPKRMTGSIELHLIWSNGPAERIGPSKED